MDARTAESICLAIKRDDVNAFTSYAEEASLGTIRFGRFPTLSLIYLYRAKKIEKRYENTFLKANSWQEEYEPVFLSVDFRKKAGRVLRLYENEIVSPLEMLLVLDKTKKIKKLYPLVRLSNAQAARLSSVWSIKYSLSVKTTPSGIEIDKRPLSYGEKRRYLLSAVGTLLCVALIVSTPFVVNVFIPFINVKSQEQIPDEPTPEDQDKDKDKDQDKNDPQDDPQETKYYLVHSLDEIDFTSSDVYTLTEDVVVPTNFFAETVSCALDGDGHTITVADGAPFGTVSGTIRNVTIVSLSDRTIHGDFALLCKNNAGTIQNVSFTVSGAWTVDVEDLEEGGETGLACIAVVNEQKGMIKGCELTLTLTLSGEIGANATFSGVCAENGGEIASCAISGSVVSTDCDLAGVTALNTYYIHDVTNRCSLSQTSPTQGWSPMCAGIAIRNEYLVRGCVNEGNVTSVSTFFLGEETYPTDYTFYAVRAAGIATYNAAQIDENCANHGLIIGTGRDNFTQVAGIASYCATTGRYTPAIKSCSNDGEIRGRSEKSFVYGGGIVAYATNSSVSDCVNDVGGDLTVIVADSVMQNRDALCGGVAGYVSGAFSSNVNRADVTLQATVASSYLGGVAGVVSATSSGCKNEGNVDGTVSSSVSYVGGVVGYAYGSVSDCASSGTVSAAAEKEDSPLYFGGIAGYATGQMQKSSSVCSLHAEGDDVYAGGILGASNYYPTYNYGASYYAAYACSFGGDLTVSGKSVRTGGIAGEIAHVLYGCKTSGTIAGSGESVFVGGIAGKSVVYTTNNGLGGGTVYTAKIIRCISSCTLSASGETSFVGGVTGYVAEWSYESNTGTVYFGGGAENCYFLGIVLPGENVRRGTIAGGCDASVFENKDGGNFSANFYVAQETPAFAVGVRRSGEGYEEGSGVGSTAATVEQMQNETSYQEILSLFSD